MTSPLLLRPLNIGAMRLPNRLVMSALTRLRAGPDGVPTDMIAEADQLTPANPFTVHTLAASHFAPITQSARLADILAALRAA
jgi:hypothetical protein